MTYKPDKKRPTRSEHYQHVIMEFTLPEVVWNSFSAPDEACLPMSDELKEELLALDDRLRVWLLHIIDTLLTDHQKKVITLIGQGKTQMEVAEELGITQPTITKTLHGNQDIKQGKFYGGVTKKITTLVRCSDAIKPAMKKIHQHWEPHQVRLPHYQTFRSILGNEDEYLQWLNLDSSCGVYPKEKHVYLSPQQIQDILQARQAGGRAGQLTTLKKKYRIGHERLMRILASGGLK